jgi:hypothetical protein
MVQKPSSVSPVVVVTTRRLPCDAAQTLSHSTSVSARKKAEQAKVITIEAKMLCFIVTPE